MFEWAEAGVRKGFEMALVEDLRGVLLERGVRVEWFRRLIYGDRGVRGWRTSGEGGFASLVSDWGRRSR